MKEIDTGKIITALLLGAIIWLFTSINTLNDSVNDLSGEIKLIQQHTALSKEQWDKRSEFVNDMMKVIQQQSEKISRLEWHLETKGDK